MYLLYPVSIHPSLHHSFLGTSEYNAEVSMPLSKYYSMHIINWSLIFVCIFSLEIKLIFVHCLKYIFIEFLTNAYIYVTQTSIKMWDIIITSKSSLMSLPNHNPDFFFYHNRLVLLILEYHLYGNMEYILSCKASFIQHPSWGIY